MRWKQKESRKRQQSEGDKAQTHTHTCIIRTHHVVCAGVESNLLLVEQKILLLLVLLNLCKRQHIAVEVVVRAFAARIDTAHQTARVSDRGGKEAKGEGREGRNEGTKEGRKGQRKERMEM